MNRIEYLRSQIERAKRFAASLTNIADRERFQGAADSYQRELDALTSTNTTNADATAPPDAVAAKSEPDTTPPDAIAASNDGGRYHVNQRHRTARYGLIAP
jgi:hypothetical protein